MQTLKERKRKVVVITIVNIFGLLDRENFSEKVVAKRGKDRKWMKDRKEKRAYNNIVLDLSLNDHEGFRRFMRVNYEQFLELSKLIPIIDSKNDTSMRTAICPKERLVLNYGSQQLEKVCYRWNFNFAEVDKEFFYYIVKEVSQAKGRALAGNYLEFATSPSDWKRIETVFHQIQSFSHCVGAVDVKLLGLE